MSLTSRTRFVNPRLGTYFGIFASSLAGLVLLLLIFEQLGTSDIVLRWAMLLGPLVLYAAIGLCVPTQRAARVLRRRAPRAGRLHRARHRRSPPWAPPASSP